MKLAQMFSDTAASLGDIRRNTQIVRAGASAIEAAIKEDAGSFRRYGRGGMSTRAIETAKLLADVYNGRRDMYHLKEAMTLSDFPYLFGDVLYRQLLGNYKPWPVTYPAWMRQIKVKDLRTLNLYTLDGGQSLLSTVKEREPYQETSFTDGKYTAAVAKYGRTFSVTMEMMLNDDLNAFQTRPAAMAVAARRTESYLATSMLCDANGPHASFFTTGNKNKVTGNPILSIAGLQTAMKVLSSQLDADNQPIMIAAYTLIVPPALETTALNIMNAIQIRVNASSDAPPGGGSANQYLYVENWMKGKVQLAVEPYIPYIASSANGDTSWFLVANPSDVATRPAFVFANLLGYEEPQLLMKAANAVTIGGGPANAMDGSFESDDISYKLRHFIGASQVDPKMAVGSNGSGS